jgi:hypothetical protein
MKHTFKKLFNRLSRAVANEIELERGAMLRPSEAVAQKHLMAGYRLLAAQAPQALPGLREAGFRRYSQFEEDGMLLYIFSLVPPVNSTCVEICAGNGRECMTTNLILNHGWWGHLFDGDRGNVEAGRRFFANSRDTFLHPPTFTQAWIPAENVNQQIAAAGATGPIDLLSLDIDGMDYWVWKAIGVVEPTVVVCETHNLIPPDQPLTVPYDPAFVCKDEDYRGASLAAMCSLAREKGYRLIGTHRYGFNAFFMKNGVGEKYFPATTPAACLNDPFTRAKRQAKWPAVQQLPWQRV